MEILEVEMEIMVVEMEEAEDFSAELINEKGYGSYPFFYSS